MYRWEDPHNADGTLIAIGSCYMDNKTSLDFMEYHFISNTSWDNQLIASEYMNP